MTDKIYAQAVHEIDWSVGQVLDALKTKGLEDNTLILFTSDNDPRVGSAAPLSGGKGSTLEGGMRMPTVIRWGDQIPAGKDNAALMTTMDILPTFAKLTGVALPPERVIDGKDIYATLTEHTESPHEYFFYYSKTATRAVRWGKWKYHRKGSLLYDLSADPGEKNNLAKQNPEIIAQLSKVIKEFQADLAKNSRPVGMVKNR